MTSGGLLEEVFFPPDPVDPVFEGMVKDFNHFDENLKAIHQQLESFTSGIDSVADALGNFSNMIVTNFAHNKDPHIASESVKLREATNRIIHADAPYSAVAKFRRDLEHNVTTPLKEFLDFHEKMREKIEMRRRRLSELRSAQEQIDECTRRSLSSTDHHFQLAQSEFQTSRKAFEKIDRRLFQWMYTLEEHKGDILDSTLQTLKYLQYEFFATSAHAISGALPPSMEFRPMVEMSPECLEAQLEFEKRNALDDINLGRDTNFSTRLIERLTEDHNMRVGQTVDEAVAHVDPPVQVDPLSLSALVSHGFDESHVRRALRIHRNDTQAALDWLVSGKGDAGGLGPAFGSTNGSTGRIPQTAGRASPESTAPISADCDPGGSSDRWGGLARVFGQARQPRKATHPSL